MKKSPSIHFFSFWKHLPKPEFLTTVHKSKSKGHLWGAWFFWNSIIALFVTILAVTFINKGIQEFETELWPQVSEFNFKFEDQKLVSTGLEEPFRYEIDDEGKGAAVFIDLKGESYDQSSLEIFNAAALINSEQITIYEADKRRTQEIPFSEFLEPGKAFSFDKQDLQKTFDKIRPNILGVIGVIIFIFFWVFLSLIRLIGMVFLSFLFMIVGKISKVNEKITFGDYFLTTLGLSFIPLLVGIGLFAAQIDTFLIGMLIYGILFAMNIYEAPKKKKK